MGEIVDLCRNFSENIQRLKKNQVSMENWIKQKTDEDVN